MLDVFTTLLASTTTISMQKDTNVNRLNFWEKKWMTPILTSVNRQWMKRMLYLNTFINRYKIDRNENIIKCICCLNYLWDGPALSGTKSPTFRLSRHLRAKSNKTLFLCRLGTDKYNIKCFFIKKTSLMETSLQYWTDKIWSHELKRIDEWMTSDGPKHAGKEIIIKWRCMKLIYSTQTFFLL